MNAQRGKGAACAANGFQVELVAWHSLALLDLCLKHLCYGKVGSTGLAEAKDSTSKAWGFQLSSEGGALVVSQILPDSVLDAWNLRCRSTGRQGLIVHAGGPISPAMRYSHLAVGQNQWCHFGVGAPPISVYFSGDWDVHWGYGILTHGHLGSKSLLACAG